MGPSTSGAASTGDCTRTVGGNDTADPQARVNAYFREAASYWSEVYERDDDMHAFIFQERLRILLELVNRIDLPRQTPVLEVGCGAGYATVAFAKLGYVIDAIDTVEVMANATCARAVKAGVQGNVRSMLGDVHALPFADQTFGLVVAMGVLPWLPSMQRPAQEIWRVLRPGGYLILGVENRWGLRQFLDPLANPLLGPAKELAKNILRRSDQRKPKARSRSTSIRDCDALLHANGVERLDGVTFGFGPLTLFGRELLPHRLGLQIHHALQRLANRGVPVIRSTGALYTVLGRKSITAVHSTA